MVSFHVLRVVGRMRFSPAPVIFAFIEAAVKGGEVGGKRRGREPTKIECDLFCQPIFRDFHRDHEKTFSKISQDFSCA